MCPAFMGGLSAVLYRPATFKVVKSLAHAKYLPSYVHPHPHWLELVRSLACSHAETSQGVPAVGEEMLSKSGMLAGASEVAAMQERSRRLHDREPRNSRGVDSGTEDRRQELLTDPSHRVRSRDQNQFSIIFNFLKRSFLSDSTKISFLMYI